MSYSLTGVVYSLLALKMLVVLLGSLQDLSKIFETEQFNRRGVKNNKPIPE